MCILRRHKDIRINDAGVFIYFLTHELAAEDAHVHFRPALGDAVRAHAGHAVCPQRLDHGKDARPPVVAIAAHLRDEEPVLVKIVFPGEKAVLSVEGELFALAQLKTAPVTLFINGDP